MRIKSMKRTLNLHAYEKNSIPQSAQQTIPVTAAWPDGIFRMGNLFSKCWRFSDINYHVASEDDQKTMFLDYCALLNSLDTGSTAKITINNRRVNRADFEKSILIPLKEDKLDTFRGEYNTMLLDKAVGANNNTVQEKYVTITAAKKSVEEARGYFSRIGAELSLRFRKLGSSIDEMDMNERLRVVHDIYRTGHEEEYAPDWRMAAAHGHSFKNTICPDSMELASDHIRLDGRYGRALLIREYANYIKDSMIAELCELNRNMMLSIDIIPVPAEEAVRASRNTLLGVETNITNFMRKQTRNSNFMAEVPYDMELQRKEAKEFLDDLQSRDQNMLFTYVTIFHTAESKQELDTDMEALLSTARKHLCQCSTMKYMQLDGLNTALPWGVIRVKSDPRTMTTECAAVLMPFRAQEIMQSGGVYYGVNTISKNLIIADRSKLLNGNGFVTGVSGSGKSFHAKREIVSKALSTEDDIFVIDPHGEYTRLLEQLGGAVIRIGPGTGNHINALDMTEDYGGSENPIGLKSDFVLSLCEQFMGSRKLTAKEKSIIDRCAATVYRGHVERGYDKEFAPTLRNFHAELMRQRETEAKEIGLAIELYVKGSLNVFAEPTNVDVDNRIVAYDIHGLGSHLKTVGMLVVLDAIFGRIMHNNKLGRRTWFYVDEIHILFENEYSANFLHDLWRRVRKYGGFCTGITQNVSDMLRSQQARDILANSEFLVMLNQAATDRMELANLLNISDTQMSYITNPDAGQGLLRCAENIVPFEDKFPKNTTLYNLMTTKPDEAINAG